MAVTPETPEQPERVREAAAPVHAAAPGRGAEFVIDARMTLFYRFARGLVRLVVKAWFRPRIEGFGQIPAEGPVVLAPVHRSFADFVFAALVTDRKLFFMAKDSLWKSKPLGRLLLVLGAFPVHRESADREALLRGEAVLKQGQLLVLFPEGTRQEGPVVQPLLEGATFLAARTGAPIVPMGIGNSDKAMPKGSTIPKPLRITLVVGEPMDPPVRKESGRVSRSSLHATTAELHTRIQAVYDRARG
jgi:1-acyl-sn-glycerol-3-phosphate acyltransferase